MLILYCFNYYQDLNIDLNHNDFKRVLHRRDDDRKQTMSSDIRSNHINDSFSPSEEKDGGLSQENIILICSLCSVFLFISFCKINKKINYISLILRLYYEKKENETNIGYSAERFPEQYCYFYFFRSIIKNVIAGKFQWKSGQNNGYFNFFATFQIWKLSKQINSKNYESKVPNLLFFFNKYKSCCAVCLQNFIGDDLCRESICNHIFHKECLDLWMAKQKVIHLLKFIKLST